MKIIGIVIDGVLRDKFNQFDKLYRRKYIKNEQIVKMDEYFRFVPEEEEDSEMLKLQSLVDEKIKYPIDTYDLMNHYKFESAEEFDTFMNKDYTFEIYGSASPIPRAMDKVNVLQKIGEVNSLYEVVLLSNEENSAIQATYHFLAKSACRVKKLIFEKNINMAWEYCDVIITDNPEIIESKPEGKKVIKIIADYNQYDQADYEFKKMFEIEDFFLLNLIKE